MNVAMRARIAPSVPRAAIMSGNSVSVATQHLVRWDSDGKLCGNREIWAGELDECQS